MFYYKFFLSYLYTLNDFKKSLLKNLEEGYIHDEVD